MDTIQHKTQRTASEQGGKARRTLDGRARRAIAHAAVAAGVMASVIAAGRMSQSAPAEKPGAWDLVFARAAETEADFFAEKSTADVPGFSASSDTPTGVRPDAANGVIGHGIASSLHVLTPTSAGADAAEPAADFATAPSPAGEVVPGDEAKAVAARLVVDGVDEDGTITVAVNRTQIVRTAGPIKRISIAQPTIADVNTLGPDLLLLTAKTPGSTQLIVWDDQDKSQIIDVIVEMDLAGLQTQMGKIVGEDVVVSSANGSIVLSGPVRSVTDAQKAVELASPFGKVLNFLEVSGGQQIVLQVQFAEVSRSVTTNLGINWGVEGSGFAFGQNNGGGTPFGFDFGNLGVDVPDGLGAGNIFAGGDIGSNKFGIFVQALRNNNLLRTLAEPQQLVLSGEEGELLAGGEVPVPVPSEDGISIDYKPFGVRLKYKPVVLGSGKIRFELETEVSDIDPANGTTIQGGPVPGFRTRSSRTVVELAPGQTLPIAGLISDDMVAVSSKVPGLGDLPYLGALFRSTRYQRRETELIVLITPRLAAPLNPGEVGPIPGDQWRHPTELEQFAYGDIGGDAQTDPARDWKKKPSQRGRTAPAPKAAETQVQPQPTVIEVQPVSQAPAAASTSSDAVAASTDASPAAQADAPAEAQAEPSGSTASSSSTESAAPAQVAPQVAPQSAATPSVPLPPPPLFIGDYGFTPVEATPTPEASLPAGPSSSDDAVNVTTAD